MSAAEASLPPREPETLSVVVTAGSRRQFLAQALASVRLPSGLGSELVVVTDFADEPLEDEVRRRHGIWVVSRGRHLGAKVADGVRAARGSILVFLDDDDLFHPAHLPEILRAFREVPGLGFYHNGQLTFSDGEPPRFLETLPRPSWMRVPAGPRSNAACERVWTLGAGYNGSSTAMRRGLLEPHLDELAKVRIGIPPYLFYRAWCSLAPLVLDTRPLTAVRLHAANTTPNRLRGRRTRFARLAAIGGALAADATTIRSFLPPEVWDVPLTQMASMGEILAAAQGGSVPARRVAGAGLELLRRRRTWLPRWTLVSLALARIGSRRGARAYYDWLCSPP